MFVIHYTKGAAKRLRRTMPPRIRGAAQSTLNRLAKDPYEIPPDGKGSWQKVWGSPNHWHVNLPEGWRLCYTIMHDELGVPFVLVLFVGTHREYDHKYGFRPSG